VGGIGVRSGWGTARQARFHDQVDIMGLAGAPETHHVDLIMRSSAGAPIPSGLLPGALGKITKSGRGTRLGRVRRC
jgi:hypothetical protein